MLNLYIHVHTKITMTFLNILLLLSLTTLSSAANTTSTRRPVAIFAFGDSILDPGNNNNVDTACHSNHKPYGVTLRGRLPSGRFSDGKLPLDILISDLGIKNLLPAFSDNTVNVEALLTGVSFATACTGLDELTAAQGHVPTITAQLRNFETAIGRMQKAVGMYEAGRILDGSLFTLAAGTNDMLNNFYAMPLRKFLTLSGFQDLLLGNLETYLRRLVALGGARFVVAGMPPIGCLPAEITAQSLKRQSKERKCCEDHNSDSEAYNTKLESLIHKMQATFPRCKFAYLDIYTPVLDMIENPAEYGFERVHEGCCGSGTVEVGDNCNEESQTCSDPSKYIFWDAAHMTQAAYTILAQQIEDIILPRLMS